MKIIETTAPIKLELLKEYFQDKSIRYVIDYKNSALKGSKLLTYMSNLDLPCDVAVDEQEDVRELLNAYFHSTALCSVPRLEFLATQVLLEFKGLSETTVHGDFIKENFDIISIWVRRLDSLMVYNTYTIMLDAAKEEAKSYPINDEDSMQGINWVSLLKHHEFYEFYSLVRHDHLQFYSNYFDGYVFKGKNLYAFWANENNPVYLLTYGVVTGKVTDENWQAVLQEEEKLIQQEMAENAASN